LLLSITSVIPTLSDLLAKLSPDARVRGEQLERVVKWLLVLEILAG
jgi:hypothetical protein